MSEMTEYQNEVSKHMATAPEELREYVSHRLRTTSSWEKGYSPIEFCGFSREFSKEGAAFWSYIDQKKWENAMATGFWLNRQQHQKPNTKTYDFINPPHYQKFSVEVIDMMAAIWGKETTAIHCEMCAFKCRLRMGEKPEQPVERDLEKVNWYLNKAKELRS